MSVGQCESGFHSSFILSSPQWPPQLSLALGTLCPLGLSFQNKQALGASSPHYPLHLNLDPTEFLRSVPFFLSSVWLLLGPMSKSQRVLLRLFLKKLLSGQIMCLILLLNEPFRLVWSTLPSCSCFQTSFLFLDTVFFLPDPSGAQITISKQRSIPSRSSAMLGMWNSAGQTRS